MAQIPLRSDLPASLSRLGFQPGLLLRSDLIVKYWLVLWKRIYRPIKPIADPLLKKLKLLYLLIILLIIGAVGNYQYWVEKKEYDENLRQKARIEQEIESWGEILKTKPNYRDVLLRLSLLNYQIFENEKAKNYWEKANYLDPNNIEVKKVGEIILSLVSLP